MNTSLKGKAGEAAAVQFLCEKGFSILEKNYRSRMGEIDIIAEREGELSFVEVKSWKYTGYDGLENAIDRHKQKKIIQSSKVFLLGIEEEKYSVIHYDIVFVDVSADGQIEFIPNAFTENNY